MTRKTTKRRTPVPRPRPNRLQAYREARAIIAVAATEPWKTRAPNYVAIAKRLGFAPKIAELADEIWNDANGPDEGRHTEEYALQRVQTLMEINR
jgi:hypothetical protein